MENEIDDLRREQIEEDKLRHQQVCEPNECRLGCTGCDEIVDDEEGGNQ
jgi:hypothetical protein